MNRYQVTRIELVGGPFDGERETIDHPRGAIRVAEPVRTAMIGLAAEPQVFHVYARRETPALNPHPYDYVGRAQNER